MLKIPRLPAWAPWAAGAAILSAVLLRAWKPPSGGGGFGGFGGSPSAPLAGVPLDPYAPWETTKEGDCDPTPKVGVVMFKKWIVDRFGENNPKHYQNITRDCAIGGPSEHHEGRAVDIMTNDLAHGQSIVDYLTAPDPMTGEPDALARRAGIMYLLWNRRIWRAYPWQGQPSGTWSDYTKGENASPHTDHVHASFSWAGARAETTLYDWLRSQEPIG